MTPPTTPQPGWYTDPYRGPGLRWWDGHRWTPHARAPRPRPPAHTGHNASMGRWTVLAQAALSVVLTVGYGYALARFFRDLGPYVDAVSAAEPGEVPPLPGSFGLVAAMSLVSLLAWIPLALELMWAHRCATAAAALGIPAKREPLWAVLSWFIPVINWWFPYESIRDCLPPGHPERRTVGRWWAGYLVGSSGVFVGVGAALIGTATLAVVGVLYAGVAVVTALAGIRMVGAIDAAHRERLAELTMPRVAPPAEPPPAEPPPTADAAQAGPAQEPAQEAEPTPVESQR